MSKKVCTIWYLTKKFPNYSFICAGGMERGEKFWKTILNTYSRTQDIVLQLPADGPMLPALGEASGRHIVQADTDTNFLASIKSRQDNLLEEVKITMLLATRLTM